MTPTQLAPKLLSWASDIDPATAQQAARASRLPFVEGHVALMPDAHRGIGATVGSVIPTHGAIIPAAVGVDIGCGMIATQTEYTSADLPDLDKFLLKVEEIIPAGVGKGHEKASTDFYRRIGEPYTLLTSKQRDTAANQYGTLGSGNHFVEVCLDETDHVWTVLHSGSRGIGNQLAQAHIKNAKGLMKERFISLEDPDLAYLVEGEPEFQAYILDMLWAQDYAMKSRDLMNSRLIVALMTAIGKPTKTAVVNCHHNFTQSEVHNGKELWITRKGAIKADLGDWGIIPGSMGTRSYVVSGKGSAASYHSCSHGAGRRMSRSKAKATLSIESLNEAMAGKTWLSGRSQALLDEHPASYKDIDQVMADQTDLVTIERTLSQVMNFKGI